MKRCLQPGVKLCCLTESCWREHQSSSDKIRPSLSSTSTATAAWSHRHSYFQQKIELPHHSGFGLTSPVSLCCRAAQSHSVGPSQNQSLKLWISCMRSLTFVSMMWTWGRSVRVSCWPPLSWLSWTIHLERWGPFLQLSVTVVLELWCFSSNVHCSTNIFVINHLTAQSNLNHKIFGQGHNRGLDFAFATILDLALERRLLCLIQGFEQRYPMIHLGIPTVFIKSLLT